MGEDDEWYDLIVVRLNPSEIAKITGSLFGKTTISSARKLADEADVEGIEQVANDDETIQELAERIERQTTAIFIKGVRQPDYETHEEVMELDQDMVTEAVAFMARGVVGEDDPTDSFSDVDATEGESGSSNDG